MRGHYLRNLLLRLQPLMLVATVFVKLFLLQQEQLPKNCSQRFRHRIIFNIKYSRVNHVDALIPGAKFPLIDT